MAKMDPEFSIRLDAIRARIAQACAAAGRDPSDVTLIAVSKEQPDSLVEAAYQLGLRDFGENKVQAYLKRQALGLEGGRWHVIGPLQTNKAKDLARHPPALIQTVDRESLVTALEAAFAKVGVRVPCLVQVNIDEEPQKAGVDPGGLDALVAQVEASPHLEFCGFMAIPRPLEEVGEIALRVSFGRMYELFQRFAPRAKILSLGMSDDFELAIAAGATHIRVGSALFGARPLSP